MQRPEPLLVAVPLVLFLINRLFIGNSVLVIHQPAYNIMQLDSGILFWIVFACVIVPFQLHFLLRASEKWDPVFCRPHVYFTVSLLILFFIAFYGSSQPLPRIYFDISPAGKVTDSLYFNKTFSYIFLIELVLQFLFVMYFLIAIFKKAK